MCTHKFVSAMARDQDATSAVYTKRLAVTPKRRKEQSRPALPQQLIV